MTKVAIYTRVSTDGQDPDNQVDQLRRWAAQEGNQIVAEYQDVASGARRREQLDDLFDDAKGRRFDLLAIWSLDRLTREGVVPTLDYIHRLMALGIGVYSMQEPYLNPNLPLYEGTVAIFADLARLGRERISVNTKAGLERAKRNGKRLGRPPGAKDKRPRRTQGYRGRAPPNKGGSRNRPKIATSS